MNVLVVSCVCVAGAASAALAVDSFAVQMVSYQPGSNPSPGYTSSDAALGEPTRYTGVGVFPSAVTPFNPPFLSSEIVSIGEGGSITLGFDHDVLNDSLNPFGVDLLIFGNAFYADASFPSGVAAALISAGSGVVEVSADLDTWVTVPGAMAESHFPTLGYSDLTDPYALEPGIVLSDFTRPVDPAFNPIGMNFTQIAAAYGGSGGGTGIDLGAAAVSSIRYVRISNPAGSGLRVEIDAVSDVVPAPGMAAFGAVVVVVNGRRKRR